MKRFKKILKWTGIVLGGLAAIGLVANAVFVWTTDTRLERQLAAIRAAGDPLTLANLARPPIPPEQNAATYLRRAKAGVDAIEKEITTSPRFREYRQASVPIPPEDQKALKALFAAYPDVVPLLEQAAACPDYDAQWDYSVPSREFIEQSLSVGQEVRANASVLHMRVRLLVAEGNYDEAVRTALVIFRLARHFDRNPMLVGYLVATAVRHMAIWSANEALQTGPISKEVRDALDAELALQKPMEAFAWALKSERCYSVECFNDIIPARRFWLVARGMWNTQESECLDSYSTFLALACNTATYQIVEQTVEDKKAVLDALLFPSLTAAYAVAAQTRAEIRSLRVLNALQTHVPAESDEAPQLDELGLPAEATTDPYTGEPLCVKKTPRGWLVYSVGKNFQDDGGKLDYSFDGDVGVGPPLPAAEAVKNDQEETAGGKG